MSAPAAPRGRLEWLLAAAVAAAVTLYLWRHRALLSELPRVWEALF